METVYLQFYAMEFQKVGKKLIYEWILETARKNGISGGSVFKAIAGYGRHKELHEERFFELASETPIKVEFYVTKEEANKFIGHLKKEKLDLFYSMTPTEFGSVIHGGT